MFVFCCGMWLLCWTFFLHTAGKVCSASPVPWHSLADPSGVFGKGVALQLVLLSLWGRALNYGGNPVDP